MASQLTLSFTIYPKAYHYEVLYFPSDLYPQAAEQTNRVSGLQADCSHATGISGVP